MYFKNIDTLEELKKQYKKLAFQHHPDRGGDVEIMKAINNEYDELFARFKDTHINKKGEYYTKETKENNDEFKKIIEAIIKMQGVKMDVVGCFLWVYGDTKPYKEQLKGLGFKWSRNKSMWYKSPAGYRRFGKNNYSYDKIVSMYGISDQYEGTAGTSMAMR